MDQIKLTADLLADGWSTREQHRRLIAATVRQTSASGVVSQMSAVVLHGLPTWRKDLARVHLTRDQPGGGKVRRYIHLHVAPLPEADVTVVAGQPVTTVARTVVDLLRTLPMEHGVPIGDAALRGGLSPDELATVAARCVGWPGMRSARRAIAFQVGPPSLVQPSRSS